jgi:hypothetical protein
MCIAALGAIMAVSATPASAGETVCDSTGPDVIVGEIPGITNYPAVGNMDAFSIATTSCNIGDEELIWIAQSTQHPVIAQHMFRLKDGRFEQIGQSWLKHGFGALQENICGCGCIPSGDFQILGVGCSDPYTAGGNGNQFRMGPKFEVNASNGVFPYPATDLNNTGNDVYKRLQVPIADLDPALNVGAQYFVEAQYVHPDDAQRGNSNNSSSWRAGTVFGPPENQHMALEGPTYREEPAIFAWVHHDPTVRLQAIDIPDDGRFHLAWTVTPVGGDEWSYEFALHNMTSDRSAGSFSVGLPAGASVSSTGFHDVHYHSGEPYDGSAWAMTVGGSAVSWTTATFADSPNANALRWGTLYNFRFVTDVSPYDIGDVVIGLFKPGKQDSITVPLVCPADVAGPAGIPDGNVDAQDMLALIAQWGTPCSAPCTADISGTIHGVPDGSVDSIDFLLLISQWGNPGDC